MRAAGHSQIVQVRIPMAITKSTANNVALLMAATPWNVRTRMQTDGMVDTLKLTE